MTTVTKTEVATEIAKALREGRRPNVSKLAKGLTSVGSRPLAAPYGSPIRKVDQPALKGFDPPEGQVVKTGSDSERLAKGASATPAQIGGLAVKQVHRRELDHDSSAYLEEMAIPESLREIIRKGWPYYMLEPGVGVRTVTAQMLSVRTDDELLSIPGLTKYRLRQLRRAIADDPGCLATREELEAAGAVPDRGETRFDHAGDPLRSDAEEEAGHPSDDEESGTCGCG